MGRGLGVHKALDQIGAFAGPLVVAGLIAWSGYLAGAARARRPRDAVAMVLLGITRRRLPEPEAYPAPAAAPAGSRRDAAAAAVPAGSPSAPPCARRGW